MQILQIKNPKEIKQIMLGIGVDPYGIKIMLPKAVSYLLRLNSVSNITANILKQEMLSLGADVAVSRNALTGKTKKTDCLLMGNLSQMFRLKHKLNKQPFGLAKISHDLTDVLKNYQLEKFNFIVPGFNINLGSRAHIVGIVNITPDSFSGDGLYKKPLAFSLQLSYILKYVEKLIKDGADILDIGGESSRPGAKPISLREEVNRVIPVIKAIRKRFHVPISIDTYKEGVAKQALDNGACIVNDISGLRDKKMINLIAQYNAGVVIMHMRGMPFDMQKNTQYGSLIDEVILYLNNMLDNAQAAGIKSNKIIIDPGIGFGKTAKHNLEILNRLREFKVLGKAIMVGPSRKSFICKVLKRKAQETVFGTVSACVLALKNGANLVRVHDVKEVKQALKIFDAVNKS